MPLFIFISGYVYNYNRIERGKYDDKYSFIKNKFMRLIVPFFTVAIIYVIPIRLLVGYQNYQGESFLSLIVNHAILGKDIGHLWYLQVLFNIFIVFYLLEKLFRKMPVWINFILLIVISIFSTYSPNIFNILLTSRYFIYFYLGYSVREIKINDKIGNIALITLFFFQFIGLVFSLGISQLLSHPIITGLTLGFSVLGSVFSCLFYYLLFTKISFSYDKIVIHDLISYVDTKSFGIYLFHSPLLYIVLYYLSDQLINPYLMVFILFFVMLFGSILITSLIEKSDRLGFILGKTNKKIKH